VKIRQAIAKAQEENNQMDIRIGVLQHILLRYTLKTHKRFDADNGDKFLVYWEFDLPVFLLKAHLVRFISKTQKMYDPAKFEIYAIEHQMNLTLSIICLLQEN